MKTDHLILITDFCSSHNLEISFLLELNNLGLINIISEKETLYLKPKELSKVEKIVVFYQDLDINLEGIDVVMNLLHKIEHMQNEIYYLQDQLTQFKNI